MAFFPVTVLVLKTAQDLSVELTLTFQIIILQEVLQDAENS